MLAALCWLARRVSAQALLVPAQGLGFRATTTRADDRYTGGSASVQTATASVAVQRDLWPDRQRERRWRRWGRLGPRRSGAGPAGANASLRLEPSTGGGRRKTVANRAVVDCKGARLVGTAQGTALLGRGVAPVEVNARLIEVALAAVSAGGGRRHMFLLCGDCYLLPRRTSIFINNSEDRKWNTISADLFVGVGRGTCSGSGTRVRIVSSHMRARPRGAWGSQLRDV
eukprot:COSAG02_NODE_562_length_20293_cov_37.104288_6_plen_228_part_00